MQSYTGSNRYATSDGYWSDNIRVLAQADIQTGNVTVYSGSAFGGNRIFVVIEYTKYSVTPSVP